MWTRTWDTCAIDWLQVQSSSVLLFSTLVNQLTSFPYSFFVHCVSLRLDSCQLFNYNILAVSLKNTDSYPVTLCLANRTNNHMISRRHRLHDCSRFIMDVQQLFTVLKKEAECPLCLETVNNPKTLICIHSFCLECLNKHANFARRNLEATIKCPVCQTSFQIPEGDSFKNLPASYLFQEMSNFDLGSREPLAIQIFK